jgi:hypothetical protein
VQVGSGDSGLPNDPVRKLYNETRKLRADYLRQLRLLQRSVGISEAEIRAFERVREKVLLPAGPEHLWRTEIEQIASAQEMEPLLERALGRFATGQNSDWLKAEAQKPYRLGPGFLTSPLHVVNGIRVGTGPTVQGPQRFARMLLLAKDHLHSRIDFDFYSAGTLVPELAALGSGLDEISALGPEAEKKIAALPSMTDGQVSSTIYELLVGAASVRKGP